MKIENDLRTQVQGRPVSRQTTRPAGMPVSNSINSQDVSPQISSRSLTNAMVMLQKAQALVQEALSVSSRLQSIAAESLQSGKMDAQEVARELAGIDNSLGQYGAASPSPPVLPNGGTVVDHMAQVKASVTEMRDMTAKGTVDRERIGEIQSSLKESERVFTDEFKTESARVMQTDQFKNGFNQQAFNALKTDIVGNSNIALSAQGNLLAGNVNYLTM